jgi:hypothetical protein
MRPPDFIIGGSERPYMLRWWIIPKNRWFNVYLHHFLRSDDDRALHDHPWWNLSVLLTGSYIEHTPKGSFRRRRGRIVLRGARSTHRIELDHGPVWTLFLTGPKIREWGFHCPKGWRHWEEFTEPTDGGSTTGKGCE